MSNSDIVVDIRISEAEKDILAFLLKDVKYIDDIFKNKKLPLNYFRDPEIKIIVEFILQYYGKYESVLVEDEFLRFNNALLSQKKIDDIKYHNLQMLFDQAAGPFGLKDRLSDEQFNRIFDTWMNAETVPEVQRILDRTLETIQSGRGLEAISQLISEIGSIPLPEKEETHIRALSLVKDIDQQLEDAKERRFNTEETTGIPTYISIIDKHFCGFEKGTLSAVGGMVGHGKSTFLMNFSRNQFLNNKKVLVITMEMPEMQWSRRVNCSTTGIDYTGILTGNTFLVPDEDFDTYNNGILNRAKCNDNYNILFIPAEAYTWKNIVREIEERYEFYHPDIIYIDQLSLIHLGDNTRDRRDVALGDLTRYIRTYAQIKNIPIVIAVQANRASVIRDPKGERKIDINIENIEDSNKISANLDNFLAIWKLSNNKAMLKIVKQREGESDISVTLSVDWKCGAIRGEEDCKEYVEKFKSVSIEERIKDLDEEDEEREKTIDSLIDLLTVNESEEFNKEDKEDVEKDLNDVTNDIINGDVENKHIYKDTENMKRVSKAVDLQKCFDINLINKIEKVSNKVLGRLDRRRKR